MSRMMNAIEHLLLVALIAQVWAADALALAKMAFVMDGLCDLWAASEAACPHHELPGSGERYSR
jgi:hypothetical protein